MHLDGFPTATSVSAVMALVRISPRLVVISETDSQGNHVAVVLDESTFPVQEHRIDPVLLSCGVSPFPASAPRVSNRDLTRALAVGRGASSAIAVIWNPEGWGWETVSSSPEIMLGPIPDLVGMVWGLAVREDDGWTVGVTNDPDVLRLVVDEQSRNRLQRADAGPWDPDETVFQEIACGPVNPVTGLLVAPLQTAATGERRLYPYAMTLPGGERIVYATDVEVLTAVIVDWPVSDWRRASVRERQIVRSDYLRATRPAIQAGLATHRLASPAGLSAADLDVLFPAIHANAWPDTWSGMAPLVLLEQDRQGPTPDCEACGQGECLFEHIIVLDHSTDAMFLDGLIRAGWIRVAVPD